MESESSNRDGFCCEVLADCFPMCRFDVQDSLLSITSCLRRISSPIRVNSDIGKRVDEIILCAILLLCSLLLVLAAQLQEVVG